MTEPETNIEAVNEIVNEEVPEAIPEQTNEATSDKPIANEIKTEADEPEFKNKKDRMVSKSVNCKDCGANFF